ncbi:MurR/RpiR family transcriptional regulator [Marinobacter sp.]|uniref:MurR/RpiR family transcriptional regulator n=1 Tax=Marinobacter sp. TaxID=50741 RepID=UPI002B480DD2|nr:MurR/RpiR family transcriptional regulator [Marinobacter sp.]HKK57819.1 MurR/RpiR family transcriptional regulator [Marinobacter sp.]
MSEPEILTPPKPLRGNPAGTVDVLLALQKHDGKFATQEQKVADFVQKHLEHISSMTIAELADHCAVSKPTVVRFCRTIGCDGFKEFKLRLAQNLAVSQQYLSASLHTPPASGDAAIDRVIGAVYESAIAMREQIDPKILDDVKTCLLEPRNLLFAGIGGGSSTVAQEGANRFFRLGIAAASTSDSYILQMRAATLQEGDVLFAISASGEADAIVAAVEIAREYGAKTVCVTRPETRLAKAAELPIQIALPEGTDIYKPTASRYIHLMIVDALAYAVAQERSAATAENLRRIRASLTAYHGRTGPQPLGD